MALDCDNKVKQLHFYLVNGKMEQVAKDLATDAKGEKASQNIRSYLSNSSVLFWSPTSTWHSIQDSRLTISKC